jgi:hypothetical protein
MGFLNRGYGQLIYGGVSYRAHRLAAYYAGLLSDPVMKGRDGGFVKQKCGNKSCCNPAHFVVVPNSRSLKAEKTPLPDHGWQPPYNEEQKRTIAQYYKTREWTQHQLAQGFRISQSQVNQIIQRFL